MGIDLEKLKSLAQKATPGPWGSYGDGTVFHIDDYDIPRDICVPENQNNSDYIAAASPDFLLALIDRLERSEAHEDHMRQWADLDMEHVRKVIDWMASLAKLLDMEEEACTKKTAMQDIYKAVERLKNKLARKIDQYQMHVQNRVKNLEHSLEQCRKRLEQAEKEASWLAERLGKVGSGKAETMCPQWDETVAACLARFGTCSNCWRQAARKAVEEQCKSN